MNNDLLIKTIRLSDEQNTEVIVERPLYLQSQYIHFRTEMTLSHLTLSDDLKQLTDMVNVTELFVVPIETRGSTVLGSHEAALFLKLIN